MMDKWEKILCVLSASVLIGALHTLFTYTPKFVSISLLCISSSILYAIYLKNKKEGGHAAQINAKNVLFGLFLIILDVTYNIVARDIFGSLDYTMLIAGLFIILLNMGLYRPLKLDEKAVNFFTYFIFICLSLYGIILEGLPFILNTSELFLVNFIAKSSLEISTFFLNFLKPCRNIGNVIDFSGYRVIIGVPCSGVESITVFLSAAIAYFISIREKEKRKIFLYSLIGLVFIFLMNILRIMIIVLVGYYYGDEVMFFVHANLGWMMFALAMIVFWYLVIIK